MNIVMIMFMIIIVGIYFTYNVFPFSAKKVGYISSLFDCITVYDPIEIGI